MPIEINDEENGGQQAEEGMQQCIGDIEEIRRGIRSQISRVERQRQAKNEQNPVQAATATATIGISTHVQFELPFLPDRDARALPYRTPLGDCKAVLYAPQHFNALGDSFFFCYAPRAGPESERPGDFPYKPSLSSRSTLM